MRKQKLIIYCPHCMEADRLKRISSLNYICECGCSFNVFIKANIIDKIPNLLGDIYKLNNTSELSIFLFDKGVEMSYSPSDKIITFDFTNSNISDYINGSIIEEIEKIYNKEFGYKIKLKFFNN